MVSLTYVAWTMPNKNNELGPAIPTVMLINDGAVTESDIYIYMYKASWDSILCFVVVQGTNILVRASVSYL